MGSISGKLGRGILWLSAWLSLAIFGVSAPVQAYSTAELARRPGWPFQADLTGLEHRLQVLDDGAASMQRQLEMIGSAKRSIDLIVHTFDGDISGKLILHALRERRATL